MSKLILDANAFIKEVNFHQLSEKYSFITHEAIPTEVRDERAKAKLQNFPYPLLYSRPSDDMIKIVKAFATQTADIASLSPVDIELIALACTLIEQNGQKDLLNLQPLKPLEFNKIKNATRKEEQVEEVQEQEKQEEEDDDEWIEVAPKKKNNFQPIKPKEPEVKPVEIEQQVEEEEDSSDEDDGEGWINNENINEKLNDIKIDNKEEVEKLTVAVLTTDFAMQNVLLQMGIPIISTDGYKIKSARRFILECHICQTLVRDATKLFCPSCGNDSLLKVSCSIESDGTIILFRKKNFKVNLRGTQYSIPLNKSKKDAPFIYCEDQLMQRGIKQQLARQKKQEDYRYKKVMKTYENGAGFEEIDFKQPHSKITVGYGRLNPNDVNDMRKIKRKNKKH